MCFIDPKLGNDCIRESWCWVRVHTARVVQQSRSTLRIFIIVKILFFLKGNRNGFSNTRRVLTVTCSLLQRRHWRRGESCAWQSIDAPLSHFLISMATVIQCLTFFFSPDLMIVAPVQSIIWLWSHSHRGRDVMGQAGARMIRSANNKFKRLTEESVETRESALWLRQINGWKSISSLDPYVFSFKHTCDMPFQYHTRLGKLQSCAWMRTSREHIFHMAEMSYETAADGNSFRMLKENSETNTVVWHFAWIDRCHQSPEIYH